MQRHGQQTRGAASPAVVRARIALVALAVAGLAGACVLALGCQGVVGSGSNGPGGGGGPGTSPPDPLAYGATGLHRLSRIEYDNTVRDLLGDNTRAGFTMLPEDVRDPFDNDFHTQQVSGALISAAETLAAEAAARALSDPARRASLVGCTPAGAADDACLESFVRSFGRRAFRRPLGDDEVAAYLGLGALGQEAGDFYVSVDLVLRAMLQDPSFLYRVEVGTEVSGSRGLFRLNDHEVGTRLAYFLWGTTPDDRLLDDAAAGSLVGPAGRRAAALRMLADGRGAERVRAFHAFWLGYQQLALAPALAAELTAETDALVNRVVFDERADYFQLFRAGETFLTDSLAMHYGLPAPGSTGGTWTGYGQDPRRGILSHGAVLAAGAKFDDTSPTLRGVFVRNRLLCQVVLPPPPSVAVDEPPPPTSSRCKQDRYVAHTAGGCADCHRNLDPIGFGLERYDRTGAFRTADKDAPECAISGDGEVVGVGTFNGPAGLGEMLIASGGFEACVVTQLFRMALGRREGSADAPTLASLTEGWKQKGRALDELLLDLIADPAFIHRRIEQ
jgi:hypothetical protein